MYDVIGEKLKTKHNNKKVAPEIKRYFLDYKQNLDKLLANLERAKVKIVMAKSQFCWASYLKAEYYYITSLTKYIAW